MKTTQSRPFRADPRRPWKRTAYVPGVLGGSVEIDRPGRAAKPPSAYGRECEAAAAKELRLAGYTVTRSHLSRGGADLIAVGPSGSRQIQVKGTSRFTGASFNAGLREVMQLHAPPGCTREVWGYVKGRGHIVTIVVLTNGLTAVGGKEPFVSAVRAAMGRRRK